MNKGRIYALIFELMENSDSSKILRKKHKEELKGALQDELDRPENKGRTYPMVLNEFAHREFLSPGARKAGYGLEHVADFLNWLEKEMEMC
ncbi:MAG: hypothetical protein M0R80_03755 [Proteobacteria bacterium]|jgi:hypothetical protein|nr:hypothetical protein [Pseudomonadota bacterium]